jgi:hypothetical protein
MSRTIRISPLNSLLFLSDITGGDPPTPIWGQQILSTPTCISFVCYPEQDGPTEITFGVRRQVDPGATPAFEGELETPQREVIMTTVDEKIVLKMEVPSRRTHICIWPSHPRWPDKVTVGFE